MSHLGWLATYTQKQMYPLDPKPEQICIRDIAHALSNLCRYNGHLTRFYSVGHHSLLVCEELRLRGFNELYQLWGLLHDSSEAYLSDIAKPAKDQMPEYLAIEKKVQDVVWEAFGLPKPTQAEYSHVCEVDQDMGRLEALELHPKNDWVDREPRLKVGIGEISNEAVKELFLMKFYTLISLYNKQER